MGECKFRKGDRVQLVDGEPVFESYRGAVGKLYGGFIWISLQLDHFVLKLLRSQNITAVIVSVLFVI